jgi:anti-sigma B factor antagonist
MQTTLMMKILEPSGILDRYQGENLLQEVSQLLQTNIEVILIDFTHVSFMDSAGLGFFILCLKRARLAKVKLVICSLNEQVKMLLEITNMDRLVKILPSQAEFQELLEQKQDLQEFSM